VRTKERMTGPGEPTSERDVRGARSALVVGAIGLGFVLAMALGLLDSVLGAVFLVLGVGAPVALFIGTRRYRPAGTWPWVLTTAALFAFLVGASMRESLDTLGDLGRDRSLLPDLVTLPGYCSASASSGSRRCSAVAVATSTGSSTA
jgi:hypothetical protein